LIFYIKISIYISHSSAKNLLLIPAEVVDPMGPILILETLYEESGCWLSTSAGTPEVLEHGPRDTPG